MLGLWWTPGGPGSPQAGPALLRGDGWQGAEPEEETELVPHLLGWFL